MGRRFFVIPARKVSDKFDDAPMPTFFLQLPLLFFETKYLKIFIFARYKWHQS